MNNGKICISVCAETAEEFNRNVKLAKPLADLIELRFDCLKESEIERAEYEYDETYIRTFRPIEQGGKRKLSLEERLDFWNSGDDFCGGDFEEDIVQISLDRRFNPVICSYHDFNGTPENLFQIYERIKFTNANIDVIKIAAQASDIADTIPIWKLLERAKSENQQIIPIAMGESGKWTRILGLAHGAFMTYAALDSGHETAPGQISAKDLIEVYRVKELNERTEIYGILGGDTSYSMSPFIHNSVFKYYNSNRVFLPFQTQNLDAFFRRMVKRKTREIDLNFKGFAVTNPHKQTIIKHLDEIDETAEAIGAVNTVKISDGKLFGYNTDAKGFIQPLQNSYGDLRDARVAVFGAGGAARACLYALKKSGADVWVFARDLEKAKLPADHFKSEILNFKSADENYNDFDIIVNATPLGTKGALEKETIVKARQIEKVKLVYDLVYNPFETSLMREADKAAVPKIGGMAMLVAQAIEQQKIWTGKTAPIRVMSAEILKRLR